MPDHYLITLDSELRGLDSEQALNDGSANRSPSPQPREFGMDFCLALRLYSRGGTISLEEKSELQDGIHIKTGSGAFASVVVP